MPEIRIHIIPLLQPTEDIGLTTASIGTIITIASNLTEDSEIRALIEGNSISAASFSLFRPGRRPQGRPLPIHIKRGRGAIFICADALRGRSLQASRNEQPNIGGSMKKLLLLPLVAIGLALVPAKQADAQVSVGVGGVGIGFGYPAYRYSNYGYPGYYGYYPRSYYSYYGGSPYYRGYYYTGRPYYYNSGHRVYRHHKHHRYYR